MDIRYPVAIDNDYAVWNAFANQYWPALYVVDAHRRIRHHAFGEGGYERAEHVVRKLLEDAGAKDLPPEPTPVEPRSIEIPADWHALRSPETYVGVARSQGLASPEDVGVDEPREYTIPARLRLNELALGGNWTLGARRSRQQRGGWPDRVPVPRRATCTSSSPRRRAVPKPGSGSGSTARHPAMRTASMSTTRAMASSPTRGLYQLVRQHGPIEDRQFEIEFLDPGAGALCFTFG